MRRADVVTASGAVWRNWARSARVRPKVIERPRDVDAVARSVTSAVRRGVRIKVVGAGQSFSPIAVAPSIQLDLHRLSGLVSIDEPGHRATFFAGTPLHRVAALLGERGLALPVLGDIDRETLGGAVSTGTHGTGDRFGGLSSAVVAVTLVDGVGAVRHIADGDPDFPAVRLGLGALGVLLEITLACVPAFRLRAVEHPEHIDDVLETFLERADGADHFQALWFPGSTTALTETYHRMPAETPLDPRSRLARFVDDEVLANGVLGAVCLTGTVLPGIVPVFARATGTLSRPRQYTEDSAAVFPERRRVRFREIEYAVPQVDLPAVLGDLRALIDRRRWRIPFPLLVRTGAAESSWMSPAADRATGWIGVHQYHRITSHPLFDEVERICLAAGGRPNWATMHGAGADVLSTRYPRFEDFRAVRDRFDPDRLFANRYLRQILGD